MPQPTRLGQQVRLNPDCSDIAGDFHASSANVPQEGEQSVGFFHFLAPRGSIGRTQWMRLELVGSNVLRVSFFEENGVEKHVITRSAPEEFRCENGQVTFTSSLTDLSHLPLGLAQFGKRTHYLTRTDQGHLLLQTVDRVVGVLLVIPGRFHDERWYIFRRYPGPER